MNKTAGQYVIFLDIDGTIMGKSDDALRKNLDTVQKVRSLGHKVFINTGRATSYMPKQLNIKKNFDGVVSGGGAIVRMGDRELFKKLMSYETVIKACELFSDLNVFSALEGEKNIYYFCETDEADNTWIKLDKDNFREIIRPDVPVEKFTVLGEILEKIIKGLKPECVTLQHPHYGEIIHSDCSKAKAMKIVMGELGLPMDRCIAMGDSMNDFDMIKAAGIGVAMDNAVDEIKDIADFVTADVDDAGVAEALYKLFNLK